jgi:hypothetical protein
MVGRLAGPGRAVSFTAVGAIAQRERNAGAATAASPSISSRRVNEKVAIRA